MGSMATAHRWKWGGTGEQAMLAWGQAQDTPGRVPCSSSSVIMGSVKSACERMGQTGLSGTKQQQGARRSAAGMMYLVMGRSCFVGARWHAIAALHQLWEEPILAEQEMNL